MIRNVFSSVLPQYHHVPHETFAQIDPVTSVSVPKITPRCMGT